MPDIAQLLVSKLIGALWWMIPLIVLVQALRSSWFKGHVGEWTVHLSARLPPSIEPICQLPKRHIAHTGRNHADRSHFRFPIRCVRCGNQEHERMDIRQRTPSGMDTKNLQAVLQISEPAETKLQSTSGRWRRRWAFLTPMFIRSSSSLEIRHSKRRCLPT